MGGQADHPRTHGGDLHPGVSRTLHERRRVGVGEDHDIGLGALGIGAEGSERLGEAARPAVVVGELRQVVLQRVERGGGQDARLAERAAHPAAKAERVGAARSRKRQGRAHRRAEPLGEADAHRIGHRGQPGQRHAGGDVAVPEAGAIEVDPEALVPGQGRERLGALLGVDQAPRVVVGVLQGQEARPRVVVDVWKEPGEEIVGAGQRSAERVDLGTDEGPSGAGLVETEVGVLRREGRIARLAVEHQGDLIGLGARGDEESVFFAQELGHPLFEGADRGVLTEDVVADLRGGHRLAHRRGGLGDGVGAEIDRGPGAHGGMVRVARVRVNGEVGAVRAQAPPWLWPRTRPAASK